MMRHLFASIYFYRLIPFHVQPYIRYFPSERVVFYACLTLALAPIWLSGKYFLTGDGPCHTYNAAVLLDWFRGKHATFYGQFYTINSHFEPNYWTHACLVAFQVIFNPAMAEKIFLSGYVLGFGFGVRFLLRKINQSAVFLSSVGMLFCWHHLLQMGFFNYSWSVVGMFWLLGFWLHCRPKPTLRQGVLLAAGWVSLYSMHPIGFTFALLAIGASLLAEGVERLRVESVFQSLRFLLRRTFQFLLTALPGMLLMADYLLRKNWFKGNNTESLGGILDALAFMTMLVTMNEREHAIKTLVILLVVVVVVGAIWSRIRQGGWQFFDFWLLFFGVALFVYLTQVGAGSLELMMPLRLQLWPWFGLIFWAATARFSSVWRALVPIAAFTVLLMLLNARLPAHRAASRLVEEWTSIAPLIKDESVLMVVNYNFNGTDETGALIGDRIWMFNHAVDYIGAERPGLIMSDNYEALLGYFPLKWRIEGDMYNRTAIDGIGFEDRPPRVDLLGFPKRSQGRQINYVLLLDQKPEDRLHERGQELMTQLQVAYDSIGASSGKRAVLYRLRN